MEKNPTDEIDVYDVLVKAIKFFKTHLLLFGLLTGLGLATSVLYYYRPVPKVVTGQMIVLSNILAPPYCHILTENLNGFVHTGNFTELAKLLNLSEKEATQIISVHTSELEQKNDSLFLVSCEVIDGAVLPKLQDGIITYLRNNDFLNLRTRQHKEFLRAILEKTNAELKSLDSLRRIPPQIEPRGVRESYLIPTDPSEVFVKIMDLTKQKLRYQDKLTRGESVQLVSGWTPTEPAKGTPLRLLLLAGFCGGILCSFLYLCVRWVIRIANT